MAIDDAPDLNYPELPPAQPPLGPAPPQIAIGPNATTALANPPAASPTPDPAAAARAAAWNAQAKRMEALTAREEKLFEERQKKLAPMYDEARAASRGLARTSEQATQELLANQQEIAPYRAPDFRQSMGEWMMLAAAFGAIGNAFVRSGTANSLTAMAGILNGANKGSLEAANQNYQTWEANARQAEVYNRQALTRYKAVMDNAQLNWDQKSAQIKMTADQYQDAIMSSAAEQKNITAMMEIYDKQERFYAQWYRGDVHLCEHGRFNLGMEWWPACDHQSLRRRCLFYGARNRERQDGCLVHLGGRPEQRQRLRLQ